MHPAETGLKNADNAKPGKASAKTATNACNIFVIDSPGPRSSVGLLFPLFIIFGNVFGRAAGRTRLRALASKVEATTFLRCIVHHGRAGGRRFVQAFLVFLLHIVAARYDALAIDSLQIHFRSLVFPRIKPPGAPPKELLNVGADGMPPGGFDCAIAPAVITAIKTTARKIFGISVPGNNSDTMLFALSR